MDRFVVVAVVFILITFLGGSAFDGRKAAEGAGRGRSDDVPLVAVRVGGKDAIVQDARCNTDGGADQNNYGTGGYKKEVKAPLPGAIG